MSAFAELLIGVLVFLTLLVIEPSTEPTSSGDGDLQTMSDGTPPPPPPPH